METDLPSDALLLARGPLNEVLDHFATHYDLPLLYQRLELLSPADEGTLAYEFVLPYRNGLMFGPLGGIQQPTPFLTFDAIFREAITSTSPYYRFLCACRAYEGTNYIRRWLKQQCQRLNIVARLPRDPDVNHDELTRAGLPNDVLKGVTKAGHLFEKYRTHRNALAHFIVDGPLGDTHINVSSGLSVHEYSLGAAILLKYARESVQALRRFYTEHLGRTFMRGTVLPMIENRDRFVVRRPSSGHS